MKQFDGKSISHFPGTLTVLRAFQFNSSGRLSSPSRNYLWTGGENRALCPLMNRVGNDHRPGQLSCSCGFYAYFKPSNAEQYLHNPYPVYGICEAWGRMSAGTEGLRAEKMKIVAFVRSYGHHATSPPPMPVMPIAPKTWLVTRAILLVVMVAALVLPLVDPALDNVVVNSIFWSAMVSLNTLTYLAYRRSKKYRVAVAKFVADSKKWRKEIEASRAASWSYNSYRLQPEHELTLARDFPGVPIYDTLEEALKAVPLTHPFELPWNQVPFR